MRVMEAAKEARIAWVNDQTSSSGAWTLPPEEIEDAEGGTCILQ